MHVKHPVWNNTLDMEEKFGHMVPSVQNCLLVGAASATFRLFSLIMWYCGAKRFHLAAMFSHLTLIFLNKPAIYGIVQQVYWVVSLDSCKSHICVLKMQRCVTAQTFFMQSILLMNVCLLIGTCQRREVTVTPGNLQMMRLPCQLHVQQVMMTSPNTFCS